jgi:hypothetical protein
MPKPSSSLLSWPQPRSPSNYSTVPGLAYVLCDLVLQLHPDLFPPTPSSQSTYRPRPGASTCRDIYRGYLRGGLGRMCPSHLCPGKVSALTRQLCSGMSLLTAYFRIILYPPGCSTCRCQPKSSCCDGSGMKYGMLTRCKLGDIVGLSKGQSGPRWNGFGEQVCTSLYLSMDDNP